MSHPGYRRYHPSQEAHKQLTVFGISLKSDYETKPKRLTNIMNTSQMLRMSRNTEIKLKTFFWMLLYVPVHTLEVDWLVGRGSLELLWLYGKSPAFTRPNLPHHPPTFNIPLPPTNRPLAMGLIPDWRGGRRQKAGQWSAGLKEPLRSQRGIRQAREQES